MAQQAFTLLDARVPLPVVQILQLVDVILAFRLSLLHVDVRQNTLHDGDLNTQGIKLIYSHILRKPISGNGKIVSLTYRFLQAGRIRVLWWSVPQYLFEQQWILDQTGAWDVQEAPQVQLPAEGGLQTALEEVLHPWVLFFLVQQRLSCQLVATVVFVGI